MLNTLTSQTSTVAPPGEPLFPPRIILRVTVFAATYFAGAMLGNFLALKPGPFVNFWPPSGLYVAMLIVTRRRHWPLLVLAAVIANFSFDLWNGQMPHVSLLFCCGNTLEAVVGAWLVQRFVAETPTLANVREVAGVTMLAAFASTMLSATVGAATIVFFLGGSGFASIWLLWWSCDALGVLLVAPVVLGWHRQTLADLMAMSTASKIKAVFSLLALVACTIAIFWDPWHSRINLQYLVIPFVVWAAWRYGIQGVSTTCLAVAIIAAGLTVKGHSEISMSNLSMREQAAALQLFLSVVTFSGLFLAAAQTERLRARNALREANLLLSTVLGHTHMMTVYLDAQFNFIWVNQAYADTCQHDVSFFPGKNHFALHPHEEHQAIFQQVMDTGAPYLATAKPFAFPDQPDRATTYWDWSLVPVKDTHGTVTGLVFTLADVTDLVLAEAACGRLFDISPEMLCIAGFDGFFKLLNPRWESTLGWTIDELKAVPWIDRVHPDDLEATLQAGRTLQKGEQIHLFENRYRCKNGSYRWLCWDSMPAIDEQAIYAFVRDITVRKAHERIMQARLDLMELAQSASLDTIIQHTLDEAEALTDSRIGFYCFLDDIQQMLTLQTWSTNTLKHMCTAAGKGSHYPVAKAGVWVDCVHQRKPVIHNDYASLPHKKGMPTGHAPVVRECVVPIFRSGRIVSIIGVGNKLSDYTEADIDAVQQLGDLSWDIVEHARAQERIRAAEAKALKLLDESNQARRALLSVVEDQRIAEDTVRRLNDELEQRVHDRTIQLEAANKELEAFAYSVAHDLRSPLRAINNFTAILDQDYAPRLDGEAKRICTTIRANSLQMARLIDDLLALSRVGQTDMKTESIDMTAMVAAVFHDITTPASRARIDFSVAPLPPATGDPSLVRQVWTNILSNAIKFSSKQSRSVIRIASSQEDGATIYSVRDNGAGFDMQYAAKLFGVFQRLHGVKEFDGTGVGLAIVQRIVQRHGGRVWADSTPGNGATFHFSLQPAGTPGKDGRT